MRIFIIADIHGNLPALEAVLADLQRFQPDFAITSPHPDRMICLGDVIGYYAHPNEVMDRVWALTEEVLIGNHEMSIYETMHSLQREDVIEYGIHPHAVWAFKWTAKHLNERNRARLESLMRHRSYVIEDLEQRVVFAHAAPCMPELMDYITSAPEAYFRYFEPPECHFFKVAFVGHSHVPQIYQHERKPGEAAPTVAGGWVRFRETGKLTEAEAALPKEVRSMLYCVQSDTRRFEKSWTLADPLRTLVAVPSVGQPRDGMPYAGYAVYDTQTRVVTMVRLPYDLGAAIAAMRKLPGCPDTLISRLTVGR